MLRSLFLALVFALPATAADPPLIRLWEKGAPGFEARKDEPEVRDRENKATGEYRLTNVHNPYVTVFLPAKEKATGAAVVIVPGGGHRELWVKHEGENVATWLADRGVAAVVLRHRLPREKDSPYDLTVHPRQDGQRAVRLVRSKAKEWNLDPNRVGMMGFSAGGETTALVCRAAATGDPKAADPIDRESAAPNFAALVYPGPLGIKDQPITKETAPPTFLLVGDDDGGVSWLVQHYRDLKKVGVPAELHIYAKTPHGFGYRPGKKTPAPADGWPDRFFDFLVTQGVVKKG